MYGKVKKWFKYTKVSLISVEFDFGLNQFQV